SGLSRAVREVCACAASRSRRPRRSGSPAGPTRPETDRRGQGMRVVVTGGTGFIGSRVVRRLAEEPGVETLVLVRATSNPWRLRACGVPLGPGPVTLAAADLAHGPALAELFRRWRPDVLVHLAAVVHHSHGCGGGPAMRAVNLYATVRLQQVFLACGGRRF